MVLAIHAGAAGAEPRGERGRGPGSGLRGGMVLDNHWHHGRSYPQRGVEVDAVPRGAYYSPRWRGGYYVHEGVWYRPRGPRFVVSVPPIGIVVPFLPPFYTTLWIGAFPYYYANDVYYAWRPERSGYEVVNPPAREDEVSEKPPSDDIFIYPKHGQSEAQQATDRYECHRWAVDQTGYDPTRPQEGSPGSIGQRRDDYQRAMGACLDARGYSVK
jgi:hypothetical protein